MNEEEKKELEKSVDETVEEMKRKIEEITKAFSSILKFTNCEGKM